jgi:flagellin-like protein
MNVFGKNERSWRKARKRGVSPIIATILLVAITVVLAAVLYVLISGLTGGGTGGKPIGGAFNAGNPVASKCTAAVANQCLINHYIYTLTVESSSINFVSALFEVKNSAGTIIAPAGTGGFAIVNIAGTSVAYQEGLANAAMTATFSSFSAGATDCNSGPCSSSTLLTSIYTIVVDMGTASPSGLGYSFVAVGTGSYSGTTSVGLP